MNDDITYHSGALESLAVHVPDGTTRRFADVRVILFSNQCLKVYRDSSFSDSRSLETVFKASEWVTYDAF